MSAKTKFLAADILSITSYIIQTVELPVRLPGQHTQWSKLTAEIVSFITQHDEELEAHTATVITGVAALFACLTHSFNLYMW